MDVRQIMKRTPSTPAAEFMAAWGKNHVSLFNEWKRRPNLKTDVEFLQDCLCIALTKGGKETVARALIGRLRTLEKEAEEEVLSAIYQGDPLG